MVEERDSDVDIVTSSGAQQQARVDDCEDSMGNISCHGVKRASTDKNGEKNAIGNETSGEKEAEQEASVGIGKKIAGSLQYGKECMEKVFEAIESVPQGLGQSKEDEVNRRYLIRCGLLREKVPTQYRNYFRHLFTSMVRNNLLYDPWVRTWAELRARESHFWKVPLFKSWRTRTLEGAQKLEEDAKDAFSSGKLA